MRKEKKKVVTEKNNLSTLPKTNLTNYAGKILKSTAEAIENENKVLQKQIDDPDVDEDIRSQLVMRKKQNLLLLKRQQIDPPPFTGEINIGCLMWLKYDGQSKPRYLDITSGGPNKEKTILHSTPLGQLLTGKKAGDYFYFKTPGGATILIEIEEVGDNEKAKEFFRLLKKGNEEQIQSENDDEDEIPIKKGGRVSDSFIQQNAAATATA